MQPSHLGALCDTFGLSSANSDDWRKRPTPSLPTAGITFVTGASGSGKSTWLREILAHCPDAVTLPDSLPSNAPLVDLLKKPLSDTISWFGRFGLGDARVLSQPYEHLSEGQKFRARLAVTISSDVRFLVVDEFLSLVDRPAARVAAHHFQKLCRQRNICAVVASAHDDIEEYLRPNHTVRFHLGGFFTYESHHGISQPNQQELLSSFRITIERGNAKDFAALQSFHYLQESESHDCGDSNDSDESTIMVARSGRDVAAVCIWRKPLPDALERIQAIAKVNRTILLRYRTIVHPSYRSLGLTRMLEPAVVQHGKTIAVAMTAMGKHFPFHLAAGYVTDQEGATILVHGRDMLLSLLAKLGVNRFSDLHNTSMAKRFLRSLSLHQQEDLRSLVAIVLSERNTLWTQHLCRVSGTSLLSELEAKALSKFYSRIFLKKMQNEILCADLLGEGIGFEMALFVKNHSRGFSC